MLLDLHRTATAQPGLLDMLDTLRPQALMRTIDIINRTHSRNALHFAAAGRRQAK